MRRWKILVFTILMILSTYSVITINRTNRNTNRLESTISHQTLATPIILSVVPHSPIKITGNDQFEDQGWPGDGTHESPYVIQNLNITGSIIPAVSITNVSVFFTIQDCLLTSNESEEDSTVIFLKNVTNGCFSNCEITNGFLGLNAIECQDLSFIGCEIADCFEGLSFTYGARFDIHRSLFRECEVGLVLSGTSDFKVHENSFENCLQYGLVLEGTTDAYVEENEFEQQRSGLILFGSGFNLTIAKNNFTLLNHAGVDIDTGIAYAPPGPTDTPIDPSVWILNNVFISCDLGLSNGFGWPTSFCNNLVKNCSTGVLISHSKWNIIRSNRIEDSLDIGVKLKYAHENLMVNNSIINSGIDNAHDDDGINHWDDGYGQGNIWSDYNGSEYYSIPGSSNSSDRWPEREGPPFIWIASTIEVSVEARELRLIWSAYDSDPLSVEIYRNGSLVYSDSWSGSDIVYQADMPSPGRYNFTAVAYDESGNSIAATIHISVLEVNYSLLAIFVGSILSILIIAVVIFRKSK